MTEIITSSISGHLFNYYLIEKTDKEGFGNVLYVLGRPFNFSIDIFNTNSFANLTNSPVAYQTVAFGFLFYKNLGTAKLSEKIV